MPYYDFECPDCHMVVTKRLTFQEIDQQEQHQTKYFCTACPTKVVMVRQPSAPSFVVKGFNAKNGYSGG